MHSGKWTAVLVAVGVLGVGVCCRGQEAPRRVRILGVGNSFTVNATRHLPKIIAADPGIHADIAIATVGGCSLERHVAMAKLHEENPEDPKGKAYSYRLNWDQAVKSGASLKEALLDGPWDFITVQQVSTGSYRLETYYPFAKELHDIIKRYAPDATIVMHETWAHRIDCPRTKLWDLPPEAMYEKLHAAYATVARELGVDIIPVGTAFENAKRAPLWQYLPPAGFDPASVTGPEGLPDQSKSLHSGYSWAVDKQDNTKGTVRMDGYHAGPAGEYLGALVWYEFFFRRDARAIPYRPDTLSEEQAASLRDVAHRTMESVRR